MSSLAFEPDPARAAQLDRAMHAALGDSLDHIRERIAGSYDFDVARLAALIARLRQGSRCPPSTFGRYYDVVERIVADDRQAAEEEIARIVESPAVKPGLRVMPIDDPSLASVADLYRRKLDTDPTTRFEFVDPPAALVAPFIERFHAAMALLDRALPALSGEVRSLLSEVVLAVGPKGAPYVFDGGSSYMLWGALFLNAEFHKTVLAMAEVIAHESAHTLLFGLAINEPLVFNPDDELFPSPLRRDPRPMDGIYHATFVSARMHWVMRQLALSGALSGDEAEEANAAAKADHDNFFSGYETVSRHAALSRNGEGLMRSAAEYMRAA